jgi:glycosyltransferase involved in cell wall biosynthesis
MPGTHCSLVISTYNRPSALELCLESVLQQSMLPGEVIIADDGSGEETRELVNAYAAVFPVPLKHVWQEDHGYQLARIRNKAFAEADYPYIVQIDGDLLLHPRFIEDHMNACGKGFFISGTRSLISESSTRKILDEGKQPLKINFNELGKKYNAVHSRLLSKLFFHLNRGAGNVFYVLGCNMAFWKDDLLKINGYNEAFTGWGKEDNDIAIRLVNAGVKLRFLKFGGIVYHLYHPERPRAGFAANEEMFRQSIDQKITYVAEGMSQYTR